ncbi:hypothetical protein PMZ80_003906 [Knufia obscura]|uniref:PRISE-like Rossmann-fold domain-containing protein n=1 Tax=Knufia obscura TaxID=1635080 RepID=A0ABR0RVK1_9EURO|nr:hypothetical protein PMZ80_003906 [Knufia obscura]
MATAIVTGATGITGSAIVEHLCKDSQYKQIFTLSRSQPSSSMSDKIKHAHMDLQSSAEDMAKDLSHVSGSVIFFCAYLARDDEGEAAKVNGAMLQNFLDALKITGELKQVKRIVLTCGLKQYGVHLGQPKQPMHETDAILEGGNWPPNFYYSQQRVLMDNAKANGYTWTVTFPQDVLGFAKGNFMNECTALGLYCSVAKLAHPDSELPFPGSKANYMAFNCWTSANLHAKFCLWAAQAPNAANQMFNVVNGDTESWQNLWPRMAARFGCKVPKEMFPGGDRSKYDGFEASGPSDLHDPAPVAVQATSEEVGIGMGMPDLKKPSTLYQQVDTTKWAKDPKVMKAWETLRDKYGLDQQAFDKATWGFLTFVLGREYSCVTSMSKARKMGWNGYEDTWDSFEETFDRLEKAKILPPVSQLKKETPLSS